MNNTENNPIIEFKDLAVATMLRSNQRLINLDEVRATAYAIEKQLQEECTTGKVLCGKEDFKEFKRKYKKIFTIGSKSIQLNQEYSRKFLIEHFVVNLPTNTLYWLGYFDNMYDSINTIQ